MYTSQTAADIRSASAALPYSYHLWLPPISPVCSSSWRLDLRCHNKYLWPYKWNKGTEKVLNVSEYEQHEVMIIRVSA